MWDDAQSALEHVFKAWGVDPGGEAIARAIHQNSLEKLKKSGKKLVNEIPTSHFRKGGHGGYKEALPEGVLADIESRFGDYLRRWGYAVSA